MYRITKMIQHYPRTFIYLSCVASANLVINVILLVSA